MKRLFTKEIMIIFAAVLLVSAVSGAALADVIWEPQDDFYAAHAEQCEYVNTECYSNGPTGYMEIFDRPDGSGVGFCDNGQLFYVSFMYPSENGDWGVVEYSKSGDKLVPADYAAEVKGGWIKLSDTIAKYDSTAFSEDHADELSSFTGDATLLLAQNSLIGWTYPNSGEVAVEFSVGELSTDFTEGFSVCYTDEQGREWIYCSYYRGYRDFWICLSEPANRELSGADAQLPEFIKPQSEALPEKTGGGITTTIIICVCAAAVISALLIVILGRRKKDNAQ